jgi:multicomponent Na+:H+ antiporter subunit A
VLTEPVSGPGIVLALLGAHLLAALVAPFLGARLGRRVLLVVAAVPAATLLWAALAAGGVLGGTPVTEELEWVPALGFDLTIRVDAFALLMVSLISGIGVLIFTYARYYFGDRPDIGRIAGLLVGFAGAMVGIVVSDNVLCLFLFWELTSITSYLLIGTDDRSPLARAAALRAFLTTGGGGLALLAGLILLANQAGTWSLSAILAAPPDGLVVAVALGLVLAGAFTKSAQFPFQFWLPGAMAAPTPVSAYLHSATMVKAGIYLIARFSPAFADVAWWRPVVVSVGLLTMLLGGWRALAQHDLKLLLAHGTTSQLGFMVVLFGVGLEDAALAGTVLLLAHALFKAALFMTVGVVDHQAGSRDLRRLTGLHATLRATFIVAAIAAASMAGLPPMLGFIAKEGAYEVFLTTTAGWGGLVLTGIVTGSILTVAYSARLLHGGFATKAPGELVGEPVGPAVPRPSPGLVLPAVLLAALTLAFGVVPGLVAPLVIDAAQALAPALPDDYLALWHGLNAALALSALTVALGACLWLARGRVARIQSALHVLPAGTRVFDRTLQLTLRTADRVTGTLQTGSLPVYLMIILATVLLVPGTLLLSQLGVVDDLVWVDLPMQLPVAVLLVVATLGAVITRRRMGAVLAVGAVGYGVAVLFVIQGAPDLALTQLLIETLALVLFVLVLRHLPLRFSPGRTSVQRAPRIVLAVLVGVFATVFTLVATSARQPVDPVSDAYVELAEPGAGAENVVNAILVDFRAFDTLGEVVVLTVAGLGVIGLVRAARRERQRSRSGGTARPFAPSPILDQAVRVLFRTVLLLSVIILLVGHDEPGGGFIGGLVAGCAFMLVYVAGGAPRLRRAEVLEPEVFLGLGITTAALAAAAGWLGGGELLQGHAVDLDLGLFGSLKLTTALAFDVGVYLVVVGLVVALLRSLGREEAHHR